MDISYLAMKTEVPHTKEYRYLLDYEGKSLNELSKEMGSLVLHFQL